MKIERRDTMTRERSVGTNLLIAPTALPTDDRITREEILRVLDRAARDVSFIAEIADCGSLALGDYCLTTQDKAALVSGDIRWVEARVGTLTDRQSTLLNCMLQREAW